ncbi:MAG: hypothetical protein U0325_32115 [Polyangiales bacterium]
MSVDPDLRSLRPERPMAAVRYTLNPAVDETWAGLAARYRTTVDAIDALTRAHSLPGVRPRPGERPRATGAAAVLEPVFLPIDARTAELDWALHVLRDGSETLGALCRRLRRHPLRPIADPDVVWTTPLNAELRASVTAALAPEARASLDGDPSRARLPRGASVWLPFPRRDRIAAQSATPLRATAGDAAPVWSTRDLDPAAVRALRNRDLPTLAELTRAVLSHARHCEEAAQRGRALHGAIAKTRLLLGVVAATRDGHARQPSLAPTLAALDALLEASHAALVAQGVAHLAPDQIALRDAAAVALRRRLDDEGFRARLRQGLTPGPNTETARVAGCVLVAAYGALGLSPLTQEHADEAFEGAARAIATTPGAGRFVGENVLAWVVEHFDPADPVAPSPPAPSPTLRARLHRAGTEFVATLRDPLAVIENLWAFTAAAQPLGAWAGNLPGPPSLAGAVMNVLLQRVGGAVVSGDPRQRRVALLVTQVLSRTVSLSDDEDALLRVLAQRTTFPRQAHVEVIDGILARTSERYQATASWTSGLGVIAGLGWLATVMAYEDGEAPSVRGDSAWWNFVRELIPLGQITQGAMVTLSAVAQRRALAIGLDLAGAQIHTEAAGSLGKAAAWLGVGISLGTAAVAMHEGNYASTVTNGVAAAAAVLTIVGGPGTVLFGVVLGLAAPVVLGRWEDELEELHRTQAQVFALRALHGVQRDSSLVDAHLLDAGQPLTSALDDAIAAVRRQSFPEVRVDARCAIPAEHRAALGGAAHVAVRDYLRALRFDDEAVARVLDAPEVAPTLLPGYPLGVR